MLRRAHLLVAVIALPLVVASVRSQVARVSTGANRSDVSWHRFDTEHFSIVYHDGLDSVAREAAGVAEAVYPVVTGNLGTPLDRRTLLFLSDLDDIPNAFAWGERYMFIWMRGILDDMPPAGIRSAGRAKWLRAVITHELTHIVIEHATAGWLDLLGPKPGAPRWFHEGTARAMEPDAWTTDLDMALRVASVNSRLGFDLLEPGVLDGTLLYETGHSLVRYMLWRFGDTIIATILDRGHGLLGFDFDQAVASATGMSIGEIRADWQRAVVAMYAAEYAAREEAEDFAPALSEDFQVVFGARLSPDRRRLAVLGSRGRTRPSRIYVVDIGDSLRSTGEVELLLDEAGIDPEMSWSPDGRQIAITKYRYGAHGALVHDLFIVDAVSGSLRRISSNASLRDPAWSPDGSMIVAVARRIGRDNLVLVDASSGAIRELTRFDGDVQIYTPSWSPDAERIAVSLFDTDGTRAIAIVERSDGSAHRIVADSANNRYPVFSPDGRRIAFTTHADGVPNIAVVDVDGTNRYAVTAVSGGLAAVQWVPSTDTILALSFDTRDRITPRLVPTDRRATPAPRPIVREKFTAWRSSAFAMTIPAPDEIVPAHLMDSGGYSSLVEIRPLVPALPVVEPGVDRGNNDRHHRYGLATAWTDPQFIHMLFAYVTWTKLVDDVGGELYYVNNWLPVSMALHVDHSIAYRRRVDGRDYFQRNRNVGVLADLPIADPSSLDIGHHVYAGAARRVLEPWNGAAFTGDTSGPDPVNSKLTELVAGYRYRSRRMFFDARYRRSEPGLGSDVEYDRIDASASVRWPLATEADMALLGRAEGAAHFGTQIPQEQLRLDETDQLDGRLLNITDVLDLDRSYRVRGIERETRGDRVVVASLGVQTRLPFFEDLFPLLSLFRPQSVLFVETGAAWDSHVSSAFEARWRVGLGGELRTEILPGLWLGAGAAYGIGDGWDLYVRLSQGL